jgi:hypothetical protein
LELPVLAAYRWKHGRFRDFFGGGFVAYNKLSTSSDSRSFGPAFRGGFDLEFEKFSIRQELRYLNFPSGPSGSTLTIGRQTWQGELLFGVTFRKDIGR